MVDPKPSLRRRRCLDPLAPRSSPSASWPRNDRDAWRAATAPGEKPLGEPGPAAHLSTSSRIMMETSYRWFLRWLDARGLLDREAAPADRARPAWMEGWLAETRARVSAVTADMMLLDVARFIAWSAPERDWGWIRKLPGRPDAVAKRASVRPKPGPPDTMRFAADALDLCAAMDCGAFSMGAAIVYRDALIVALACYHAPRPRNLAEPVIGEHLLRVTNGIWRLRFRRTKNREPLVARLGGKLVPCLERYLKACRPLLLGGRDDHGWLWVDKDGLPLSRKAFHGVFWRMGLRLVGQPLHPNIVRHGMATRIMTKDSRGVATAAAALGHRGTGSVEKAYDLTGEETYMAEWQRILAEELGE
jgi:integrase